jgi:phospholipase C
MDTRSLPWEVCGTVAGRSLRAFAGLVGATSVSGMAEALGVRWPPPPISVRELMNLALVRSGAIKHIFVLVLENRSFDHMLGASTGTVNPSGGIQPGIGVDAVTGQPTTVNAAVGQTNAHNGTVYGVRPGAPFVMPVDPPHEFCDVQLQLASTPISGQPADDNCDYSATCPTSLTMAGFVENYYNQATVEAAQQAGKAALADLGAVMACFTQAQVPVLSYLASQFAVCDQWYSALPGPTWPNRFFLHAATSGGLDHSPSSWQAGISYLDGYKFENGTIYNALDGKGLGWGVYHGDDLPQILALHGMDPVTVATHFHDLSDLAADLQDPGFSAAYIFIEPNYGHVLPLTGENFQCGNSQHPIDDVTRGEALIKYVYESIRQSLHWESSLLVVTYDEHGGFYDHVPPPPAVPPGDTTDPANNSHGFRFDQQGVRVPAVIVSPWIPIAAQADGLQGQSCNLIDHTRYDHGSLLATVERLYGLSPLTMRDAQANDFIHLLSVPARDAPLTLPSPADSGFSCDDPPVERAVPGPKTTPAQLTGSRQSPGADAVATAADTRPITPAMRGFVETAAIMDARLHPDQRERVARELQAIHTLGEARTYVAEVTAQLRAARPTSNSTR